MIAPTLLREYKRCFGLQTQYRVPMEMLTHNGVPSVRYATRPRSDARRSAEVRLCSLESWAAWERKAS